MNRIWWGWVGLALACGPAAETVTLTRVDRFLVDGQVVEVPLNPDALPKLRAWTSKGDEVVEARLTSVGAGKMTLEVPMGEAYWVLAGTALFWSRDRTLNVGATQVGRGDAVQLDGSPSFDVTASGLTPWGEDTLELVSASVGALADVRATDVPMGATELTNHRFTYETRLETAPALDASKGDEAMLLQKRTDFLADATGSRSFATYVVGAAKLGKITTAANRTTAVTAAFTAAPQNSVTADLNLAAFRALAAEVHPLAKSLNCWLAVDAVIPGETHAFLTDLLSVDLGDVADGARPFHYGNPRSDWAEEASLACGYSIPVEVPDTKNAFARG